MSNTLGPKDPDHPTEYAIDPRSAALVAIRRNWPYAAGALAKGQRHTGFYYQCTTAGETKANWPELPRAEGETVADGSVVWTTRHPSSASLPSISSVAWSVTGLTVTTQRTENGIVYATLAGGEDGVDYELTATVTWSTGQVEDITVVIPVRAQ